MEASPQPTCAASPAVNSSCCLRLVFTCAQVVAYLLGKPSWAKLAGPQPGPCLLTSHLHYPRVPTSMNSCLKPSTSVLRVFLRSLISCNALGFTSCISARFQRTASTHGIPLYMS